MRKINKTIPPIHPGETLREEFLMPLGLTANRLAIELIVPVTRINDIVRGRRTITADTALRLARYFNVRLRPRSFMVNTPSRSRLRSERCGFQIQ